MKELMLGNKAFARGLYEAGCCFVSSYPGTPSTEITEEVAKFKEVYAEWAPNEKVAVEAAFGACLAGKRSFCGMKHVGMNVAADPMFTISYTGVNAGMVIGVADDPGMHSSQNEQDSRHYAKASKIPMLEPSDSNEVLHFVKLAYSLSEEYDTPVIVRMCTRIAHCQSITTIGERKEVETKEYKKEPTKYIMTPANAKKRHPLVEERTKRLIQFAETSEINRVEKGEDYSMGFITSSTSYQYIKEVCGDKYPVLKLGMVFPLPIEKIIEFSKTVDEVVVVEELDGYIEEHCKNLGIKVRGKEIFGYCDELSQNLISSKLNLSDFTGIKFNEIIPARPPAMCAGCPHRGLFYILKKNNITVLSDIGCYSLGAAAPLNAADSTICMGASISGIHGFLKASEGKRDNNTVAVIGESTFMHSGITGLINVAYNDSNSTCIILDNSTTGMTGHQQNPTTGFNLKGDPCAKVDLETLCKAVGIENVFVVDPYNLKETEEVIKREMANAKPSVIISRRPCALLKHVKHIGPIKVDTNKCVGCKNCMQIGCPAISVINRKAVIDQTLCVGCGVCGQLCKVNALPLRKED